MSASEPRRLADRERDRPATPSKETGGSPIPWEPTPTLQLLSRVGRGDDDALRQLIARDLPWVRTYIERRIGPLLRARADAEDYVQEAVVEALRYGPRILVSDRDQFRALLGRITENVLRDQAVRLHARRRDVRREVAVTDSVLPLDGAAASMTTPSSAADLAQHRGWVRLAVELLEPEDRQVVRMREWQEASFAEIAEWLGVSEDAARMRFRRILPRLARNVEDLKRGHLDRLLPVEHERPQP